jgi:hypothetical protein
MTTFDWAQVAIDVAIAVAVALHGHPINWRRL